MRYYPGYKRPYKRQSYRLRRSTGSFGAVVLLLTFLSFSAPLVPFIGWGILAFLMFAIIGGIIKSFNPVHESKSSAPRIAPLLLVGQNDTGRVNLEKHACKCYAEKLSDSEYAVSEVLSRELSYKDYFIFNNLILPFDRNGSTQIDHIVVSKFGIFVIETKDFNGWIFGNKDQPYWTVSLPGGNQKYRFQNPIRQNYAHILALKQILPFVNEAFYSIVVFTEKSTIKTAPMENVVYLRELIDFIQNKAQDKLSEEELQLALGKLSYACQTVDITPSEHVANLYAHHSALA